MRPQTCGQSQGGDWVPGPPSVCRQSAPPPAPSSYARPLPQPCSPRTFLIPACQDHHPCETRAPHPRGDAKGQTEDDQEGQGCGSELLTLWGAFFWAGGSPCEKSPGPRGLGGAQAELPRPGWLPPAWGPTKDSLQEGRSGSLSPIRMRLHVSESCPSLKYLEVFLMNLQTTYKCWGNFGVLCP